MPISDKFENISVTLKANVYFDGKVVSHSIFLQNGTKKTVGIIYPGAFKFNTEAPERMDIIAGTCQVKLAGQAEWVPYGPGSFFKVPGKSSFEITVDQGLTEYLCSFE